MSRSLRPQGLSTARQLTSSLICLEPFSSNDDGFEYHKPTRTTRRGRMISPHHREHTSDLDLTNTDAHREAGKLTCRCAETIGTYMDFVSFFACLHSSVELFELSVEIGHGVHICFGYFVARRRDAL
jgi:hypothetical protein